ncbi:MAG: hypothetical protein JL50_10480 [Peptococcaceae bacterium BICA1-7]|nr:MAG: hypothetical protein JL50_10480 [Peptococcaceae bacterium BICA1-7]HBV95709.1 class I SAM-dependent methyltransferase [Desulfotomaculum sp.]
MKSIDFDFVADLYDFYVNTTLDVPFFYNEAKKCRGNVLELMCGTGRISIPLLEKGISMTCVDYSRRMLEVFSRKIEGKDISVKLVSMDVCSLALGEKYNLIFIPFNSFSEILTEEKQLAALDRIYGHLLQNGRFICTMHNPKIRLKTADGLIRMLGRFSMNDEGSLVLSYYNSYNKDSGTISGMQFYEIYNKDNLLTEKRFVAINFSLLDKVKLEHFFVALGFSIENLYGDYSYGPFDEEKSPYMIWVLKKQSNSTG